MQLTPEQQKAQDQQNAHAHFAGIPPQIQMSEYEQRYIGNFPPEVRFYELCWFRAYKRNGWKGMEKIKRKEAFRQGWNSCVFANADYYVLSKKEQAAIAEEKAKFEEEKKNKAPVGNTEEDEKKQYFDKQKEGIET